MKKVILAIIIKKQEKQKIFFNKFAYTFKANQSIIIKMD